MASKHATQQQQARVLLARNERDRDVLTIACSSFLTCNTLLALVRALAHKDYDSFFYILFIYFCVMSLFGCLKTLQIVPRQEELVREVIKGAILMISLSLSLTIALKFAPILGTVGLWIVLGMGVVSGFCCIFCDEPKVEQVNMKNKSLESSSPMDKV